MSIEDFQPTPRSLVKKTLSLITVAAILSACSDSGNRNQDVVDTTPPTVTVLKPFVSGNFNSYGVDYDRNCLYLADSNGNTVDVVNRYDRESNIKDVWVSYYNEEGKETSRHTYNYNSRQPSKQDIYNSGKVLVKVGDTAGNVTKSDTVRVRIDKEEPSLMGLENLENLHLEVGKAVNLLEGITYNGESAQSIYEKGNLTVTVNGEEIEPTNFIPSYSGRIEIELKFGDGNDYKINKIVVGIQYEAPKFEQFDIKNKFPFYENYSEKSGAFAKPYLQASYIAESLEEDSLQKSVHIIVGEVDGTHVESQKDRIKALSSSEIICIKDRESVKEYIDKHPKTRIFMSCSDDTWGSYNLDDFKKDPNYKCIKDILEKSNVTLSSAIGNKTPWVYISSNENVQENNVPNSIFTTCAINGPEGTNKKITILGFSPESSEVKFSSGNIDLEASKITFGPGGKNDSCFPNCYDLGSGNVTLLLMDFFNQKSTFSSNPTAEFSAISNDIDKIIKKVHGDASDKDISNIWAKYLKPVSLVCIDENGKELYSTGYVLDMKEFLQEEILKKSTIDKLTLEGTVPLPSMKGTCYTGEGCQFWNKDDKCWTDVTKDVDFSKIYNANEWRRSSSSYKKYTHPNENKVSINVRWLDKNGQEVEKIEFEKVVN